MKKLLKIFMFLTVLGTTNSYATTWNEPWAEKVIKEASSFVLGKVISTDPKKGITVFVLKTVSGKTGTKRSRYANWFWPYGQKFFDCQLSIY